MMKVDRYDIRILQALQQNAHISNQDLADLIGLTPSPCLRRVRQLEESGLITARVTLLNPQKLGLSLTVLIHISMDRHTPERFEHFEETINSYDEVIECLLITGQSADYMVKVMVPDMNYYQDFLLNKITKITGVTGVHSSFVLRQPVHKTALPLNHLKP
ncbi:Lrp/AsnC family transcriptional regulator [Endozoicomonas sp. GU-1]|uniref:Lrp/AsnC family transcriptional regulator n=2 Tax=Endozoicomonas sp. GU-1 TaxID=3009078 RepID=UPI0022B4946A|nr:Lrp/AsnC family transcriptional regulator [Endozoicomonas sp. GU-1]WBA84004.1 Lrp/AsnC family transcriptional regulator [Endozoicomonas sp. GU-1]WBA88891.1 Lrp/AsnC family transcriptional regulator [Endozoicomonas sp. GU-1]